MGGAHAHRLRHAREGVRTRLLLRELSRPSEAVYTVFNNTQTNGIAQALRALISFGVYSNKVTTNRLTRHSVGSSQLTTARRWESMAPLETIGSLGYCSPAPERLDGLLAAG